MEEKIEILLKFDVSPKKLHLLNQRFDISNAIVGECSSYHDKMKNEADWFFYQQLCESELIIATSDKPLLEKEIIRFIIEHNGYSLSRDNLFNLMNVFGSEMNLLLHANITEERKFTFSIIAYASQKLLPEHNDGRHICPMLVLEHDRDISRYGETSICDYDWSWIDYPNMPIYNFAFWAKKYSTGMYY